MVKPLTFKGDKKAKKRKRSAKEDGAADAEAGEGSSSTAVAKPGNAEAAEPEGWVTIEQPDELTGPLMLTFVTFSFSSRQTPGNIGGEG